LRGKSGDTKCHGEIPARAVNNGVSMLKLLWFLCSSLLFLQISIFTAPARLVSPEKTPVIESLISSSVQNAERGKFILYKYGREIGAESYEIKAEGDALTLKTNFELSFVGDKVALAATLRMRKADFSPLKFESKGRTSTRTEVDTTVEIDGKTAVVRNDSQTKSQAVPGKFFTAFHPAPIAPQMMLFRYSRKNNVKGDLPLLPGGKARIEFLGKDKINVGGSEQALERYSIEGVMWGRETVWFDARQNLVALVGADAEMDRFEAVKEGFEEALPVFVAKAAADAVRQLERLSEEIKPVEQGKYAFVGATVIGAKDFAVVADAVVLIENGRIAKIGKRSEIKLPKNVKIIEASGKTLLPGLFDTHAHATQSEWFPASLAAGITTMRDAANELEFIVLVRDAIKNDRIKIAPRLVLAGYIDSGENALGTMRAETPGEARALVQKYKQNDFEQIKIYQSLKPELVKIVSDEAHKLGMTVTGHVPSKMNIYGAVENGFDQINHVNFAFRAMLPKDFKPQSGQPPKIEPESEVAQTGLKFLADNKTIIEPTLARSELNLNVRGKTFTEKEPGLLKAPFEFASLIDSMGVPAEIEERAKSSFALSLRVTKALHQAGIPLTVGTDLVVPGHSEHREIELLVEAGLSPIEAIKAATIVPAQTLNLDKESGTIEAGKLADLILIDGNPLKQISEIRNVKFVVKNGRMYDTARLWRSIGFQP
jgi:imidazolonepropionase-like amidohydrolase